MKKEKFELLVRQPMREIMIEKKKKKKTLIFSDFEGKCKPTSSNRMHMRAYIVHILLIRRRPFV